MEDIDDIARDSSVFPEMAKNVPEKDSFNASGEPLIKVIGVGGGGGNAVNYMYRQDVQGVSFVVANTDRQALNSSPVPKKLLLGPTVCDGMGAGNKPEKAKAAAEESAEKIADLFDDDTKMVFITAGMGGGTGTGASPVVARIAREKGKLTVGIVTIPFLFEGEKKIKKALNGADELAKHVDALLVINNERLTEIYSQLTLDNAMDKADETLSNAARSISDLINFNGHINLDFADVNTTLSKGGTAIISTGYGEGERRVTKAIHDALNSPLLKNRDIQTSKRFLFNIYYSSTAEHPFQMGEMSEITEFMNKFVENPDLIWGKTVDDSLGDKVKMTVLAAGFEISLNKEVTFSTPDKKKQKGEEAPATPTDDSRIIDIYGVDKVGESKRQRASANYILLTASQMDNDVLVNFIEKYPTYRRGVEQKLREEWKALCEERPDDDAPSNPGAAAPGGGGVEITFD